MAESKRLLKSSSTSLGCFSQRGAYLPEEPKKTTDIKRSQVPKVNPSHPNISLKSKLLELSPQKNSISHKAQNTGNDINQIFHLRSSLSIYFFDLSKEGIAKKINNIKNTGQ